MTKDDDYVDKHIYGARLLMENLWDHVYDEFPDIDKTAEFIALLLDDITEFHKTHVCENCEPEEPSKEIDSPTATVLPFRNNKDKDWTKN